MLLQYVSSNIQFKMLIQVVPKTVTDATIMTYLIGLHNLTLITLFDLSSIDILMNNVNT